jgi:hypothetical protein
LSDNIVKWDAWVGEESMMVRKAEAGGEWDKFGEMESKRSMMQATQKGGGRRSGAHSASSLECFFVT